MVIYVINIEEKMNYNRKIFKAQIYFEHTETGLYINT